MLFSTIPAALRLPSFTYAAALYIEQVTQADVPVDILPPLIRSAVPKRQREYYAGRLCARQALTAAGCLEIGVLSIGDDRLPQWPQGWRGSISHSGQWAMAIVATVDCNIALGIDVQRIESLDRMRMIGPLIAEADELRCLASMMALPRAYSLLFSAKESLFKALYPHVRKYQNFDEARLIQAKDGVLCFKLSNMWAPAWPSGTHIRVTYTSSTAYVMTAACIPLATDQT